MDYFVGGVAALISGNVTPNRPKLIRRALTPTKHPSSPNVTPKSEFVEDRSIFLSPTQQKKKAIVKKSPKRIFQNPDLDLTENNDSVSPKAEKVKKHLKDELEAEENDKSINLSTKSSNKLNKSLESDSPSKKAKINHTQYSNENTTIKKKRKSGEAVKSSNAEDMDIDQSTAAVVSKNDGKSPKKKQRRKSVVETDSTENQTEHSEVPETIVKETKSQKKNKKRKKNKQNQVTKNADKENKLTDETREQRSRKNKNKKNKEVTKITQDQKDIESASKDESHDKTPSKSKKLKSKIPSQSKEDDIGAESDDNSDSESSGDEISNTANPNAITEKDSESEHDSDNEIESENEETNNAVLKTDEAAESSDEETKPKKGKQKEKKIKEIKKVTEEVSPEEEIRRTLFVGNVPFSSKCKKEIKKIFAQYGDIQTVRIRTVPLKDARVTPKLAVIKNEIHPDRSTVNVYVKFADPDSVDRALAENNTVLNCHHLRVSRSSATGVEHNPQLAVFLGNLPFGVEDETLRAKFDKCGPIESVRIVRDKKTNAGKGFGYINFASKDGVELALLLQDEDLTIKNRIIRVKRCTNTNKNKKNFGNKPVNGYKSYGTKQGQKSFGNNQGQNSFGNSRGQNRSFGNNQGNNRGSGNNQVRNYGNNQGQNRNFGNQQRNQGPSFGNKFGEGSQASGGAARRILNKRPHPESGDGPPNKRQNLNQPKEKKQRKEFVGITAEKKKKQKFDKTQKKKKAISEILAKK